MYTFIQVIMAYHWNLELPAPVILLHPFQENGNIQWDTLDVKKLSQRSKKHINKAT